MASRACTGRGPQGFRESIGFFRTETGERPRAEVNTNRFRQIVTRHLREVWGGILMAVFCISGYTAMELLAPWPIKVIFDHILLDKPLKGSGALLQSWLPANKTTALVLLSLSIVVIATFRGLFAYSQTFITARLGYQMVYKLRRELFLHLQKLSLSFHTRARSGELLTKVTTDTAALKDLFAEAALTVVGRAVQVVGMVVIMIWLNWQLGLVVLAVLPVLCFSLFSVYRRIKTSARMQRTFEGRIATRLSEVIGSISLVHAFAREEYERERFDTESTQTLEEGVRTSRMTAAATRLTEIVSAFGIWAVVMFGGFQVLDGKLTPGAVLVFISYVTNMYKPLRTVARTAGQISKASVSAERISEILNTEPDAPDLPSAREAASLRGEIVFSHVRFGYGDGQLALDDVSFRIAPGERVALVGASGSGKSTIASLILRLYSPQEGTITIDGIDVRDYKCESVRREIGIVLQDAFLFGASIRENIAYGKPDATSNEVQEAACQAYAHDFISALPDGYDTIIGERGCTLSGGQRQRLCLARAIIKRPSILILDEPTSAVDAESAALIQDTINRIHRGKTLLLISHQLLGLDHFDRILVLRHGELIEQGTHAELILRGGYYQELCRLQGFDLVGPAHSHNVILPGGAKWRPSDLSQCCFSRSRHVNGAKRKRSV